MCDNEDTRLMLEVIESYRHLVNTLIIDGGRPTNAVDLAYTDLLNHDEVLPDVRSFLLEWRHDN